MNDVEHLGAAEAALASLTTDAEFREEVARQFATVNLRLSSQDVAIDGQGTTIDGLTAVIGKISEDTGAMRAAWNDGVATKRLFCRLAESWKFMYRQVFLPFAIPATVLYAGIFYAANGKFPAWVVAAFKAFF